jgi:Tol biopolymer transport system component
MLALIAFAGLLATAPAQAAFPGQNGKIAFVSTRNVDSRDIFVMNADGSGETPLTENELEEGEPAWSPDGTKVAFRRNIAGNREIFVIDGSGSGEVNLTDNAAEDHDPAWSPDGTKIAYVTSRAPAGIHVMNAADGTGSQNIGTIPGDGQPAWSPDGTKIAFARSVGGNMEIFVINADGSGGEVNLTNNAAPDRDPAWSPDGTKIAFTTFRDGNSEIYVMDANGMNQVNRTKSAEAGDGEPAWSPDGTRIAFSSPFSSPFTFPGGDRIFAMDAGGTNQAPLTGGGGTEGTNHSPDWARTAPPSGKCGDTTLQLNRATVEGTLVETGPGTGVFSAGPGDVVYVGGFELRPRFGGELLVDTTSTVGELREEGTGVQVFLGRFEVPLAVGSIPINLPEATIPLNRDGTLLKSLFSLPISGQLKAAWADGGKSAGLEFELEVEKLVGNFGSFTGAGVTAPSLKVQAKQANCTGFDFTGAEIKADEISFIPKQLKVPRKLGLKNVLFKYEERDGRSLWAGQGELIVPTGTGELAVGGKVSIADSKLAGVGVSASGINRPIGYGLFLQSVAGELAFEPDFAFSFGVGATFGPQVKGKKLVKLSGTLKNLALATECANGEDPIALVASGSIPVVEELGAGSVKIEGVNCIYTASLAIEQSPKVEAVFGEVVGGEVPKPVVAAKANLSGFVGVDGINAEGGGSITIPLVGEVAGQALMSSKAFAACGGVGFFKGGAAHVWGESRTEAFSGCDLAPWRVKAGGGSSALARGLVSPFASGATGQERARASAAAATVEVEAGLPFVGFAARGAKRAPRVRVSGPKGERFTSRKGKAVVRRDVVMVPVAAERRTFVFVKAPSAGRWRIEALGGERLRQLRTAEGLPRPAVSGQVSGRGPTRTLKYTVKPIPGQRVTFFERTKDGIAQEIGRATAPSGRVVFSPASTGQPARIDAAIVQNGFPRDTVTIARLTNAEPGAGTRPPGPPRRVRAVRRGRGLVVKWSRVAAAARYRVDLLKGRRRVARRTVSGIRLRLKRVPAVRLRVEVRAISRQGAVSKPRGATIGAIRGANAGPN